MQLTIQTNNINTASNYLNLKIKNTEKLMNIWQLTTWGCCFIDDAHLNLCDIEEKPASQSPNLRVSFQSLVFSRMIHGNSVQEIFSKQVFFSKNQELLSVFGNFGVGRGQACSNISFLKAHVCAGRDRLHLVLKERSAAGQKQTVAISLSCFVKESETENWCNFLVFK